jgi:MFS family permease
MTPVERRATFTLAGIFALRMLGLFLILPVFSLYAHNLKDVTPTLTGLAIGAYGFTQALLQIPLGILSDRIGRRPVIVFGLMVFAIGSVVAALGDSIYVVIVGRCLQGSGAISAAVMALTADLTREEQRTKAMAIIGLSIGLSFALALVAGPLLASWFGLAGIFWITAGLAVLGLVMFQVSVPEAVQCRVHRDAEPVLALIGKVFRNGQLLRLNIGILCLHLILTATFVVLPLALRDTAGLESARHWHIYLPVLVLSVLAMTPFIIVAEKQRRMKQVFIGAIVALGLAEFGMYEGHGHLLALAAVMVVYFTAINLLEASLPSLITKIAPPDSKGTAMGIYATFQFFGAGLGGVLGGALYGRHGLEGVFLFCTLIALVWLVTAATMKHPRYLGSHLLNVGRVNEAEARNLALRLTAVRGVAEAVVIASEGVAYLKVDKHALDTVALSEFSASEG